VLAAVLAGCGGGGDANSKEPTLPRPLAERLAAQSEAVADALAAGEAQSAAARAAKLRDEAIAAIDDGRVPPELQEELGTAVNLLAEDVARAAMPPPTTTDGGDGDGDGDGDGEGDGDDD
jgi:hypothetical protein